MAERLTACQLLPLARLCQEDYAGTLLGRPDVTILPWRSHCVTVLRQIGRPTIVVFRGTQLNEPEDIFTNIRAYRCWNGLLGWHHGGFGRAAMGVWIGALGVELNYHTDTRLTLVGHSLGGALALLVARLLPDHFREVRVVTFGAPRAMFAGGRRYLLRRCRSITQITRDGDPIPHIPTCLLGWRHVNHYPEIGHKVLPLIRNHAIRKYVNTLTKMSNEERLAKS